MLRTLVGFEDHDSDARWVQTILTPLSELRVCGEELRLRFAPGEDGWIRLRWSDDGERSYRPAVARRIAETLALPTGDLPAQTERIKGQS